MKKLLPFLMALAMLPAVAFGASDDTSDAGAAVTDVPGDAGTMEGPPESVEEEENGQTQGQSGMSSGSADMDITTESEEGGGTTEGEARETPFDEDDVSASDSTTGMDQDATTEAEDDGGTQEGQPESVEEEEIN